MVFFSTDSSHYCNMGDVDADGVTESEANCFLAPSGSTIPDAGGTSQLDADSDGYGAICDPDFDNNNSVDFADLAIPKPIFWFARFKRSGTLSHPSKRLLKLFCFGKCASMK